MPKTKKHPTAAEIIAAKLVEKAFEGRTGHGGGKVVYRQMSREELAVFLQAAYEVGVEHGVKAGRVEDAT